MAGMGRAQRIGAALALGSGALWLMRNVRIPQRLLDSRALADVLEFAIESGMVLVGAGLLVLSIGFVVASAREAYGSLRAIVARRSEHRKRVA